MALHLQCGEEIDAHKIYKDTDNSCSKVKGVNKNQVFEKVKKPSVCRQKFFYSKFLATGSRI